MNDKTIAEPLSDEQIEAALAAVRKDRQPTWIKSWSLLKHNQQYLVLVIQSRARDDMHLFLYAPQILLGWQIVGLKEGLYIATEFHPPRSLDECE